MMTSSHLAPFTHTLQKADQWMGSLSESASIDDTQKVYRMLRATLHALRDQLVPTEAAHLAAQMPTLLRGVYYEGWNPSRAPEPQRSQEAFLERVSEELEGSADPDPETAARSVFRELQSRVTAGEIEDVRQMLPEELRPLWDGTGR